jgi:hypothetical protein
LPLTSARRNRELEGQRAEIDRRLSQIDDLLGEKAWLDAEILLRNALRDYPDEERFQAQSRRLSVERLAQVRETEFRQAEASARALMRDELWSSARQLIQPFLDEPATQHLAAAMQSQIASAEDAYRARVAGFEQQAHALNDAGKYEDAVVLLRQASTKLVSSSALAHLLKESLGRRAPGTDMNFRRRLPEIRCLSLVYPRNPAGPPGLNRSVTVSSHGDS